MSEEPYALYHADMSTTLPRAALGWRYRVAAWLVIGQAVVMEIGALLALPVLVLLGVGQADVGERFHFALPYFQDNLSLLMVMSGIFGVLRLLGGIGVLCDRLWGLALTVVMCVVTLVLMIFLLPAGIADGLLSGGALVLIAFAWFGRRSISARRIAEH
ncbi:hypothetical protein P2P98_16270 [Microbacterium sp. Kw_RZR3]|uniref:hypothetical protein n=1 Tax=Microbacterium sp. Kw_RZR3 TaxID=3032903 RepID=UPI0023DC58CF|nr:hypothetical protein [Microbacterium sp. Kw_RZR3]MDF2047719.1 hypothetical protein [Microbacterium sp. Kw_RZR3]